MAKQHFDLLDGHAGEPHISRTFSVHIPKSERRYFLGDPLFYSFFICLDDGALILSQLPMDNPDGSKILGIVMIKTNRISGKVIKLGTEFGNGGIGYVIDRKGTLYFFHNRDVLGKNIMFLF